MIRRVAAVLAAVTLALAACGGDDSGGDVADGSASEPSVTSTTDDPEDALEVTDDEMQEAIDSIGECVLADGDEVTMKQLEDSFCSLATGAPDTFVAFVTLDGCSDGTDLWVAGEDEDDPSGGWVKFDASGTGTWHSGAYGEVYNSCYS